MSVRIIAFVVAAGIIIAGWLFVRAVGKGSVFDGADGRPSTSKTQAVLWTCAVIFGYLAVFIERWVRGDSSVGVTVPQNLLLAMGFSAVSMVSAKAVTTTYVALGMVDKSLRGSRLGGLFTGDDGIPDLAKIQNMAFTAIALGIYVIKLGTQGDAKTLPVLVDIDPTLMILMGLSHAGYLGDKLVTKDSSAIARMRT